jgi:hypothetical protein
MKYLVILASIFLVIPSFAQDFGVENEDHYNVIYRGFENQISIGQFDNEKVAYDVEGINCSVELLSLGRTKNKYLVKTNTAEPMAEINFVSKGRVIGSKTFKVENLPQAKPFWGPNEDGSYISDAKEIRLAYSSGITLIPDFEVVSWDVNHQDHKFNGEGSALSQDFLTYANSLDKGEEIHLVLKVKTEDGTLKKLRGSWTRK